MKSKTSNEKTKSPVYTNWTTATKNPNMAIGGLLSCLESGKNAWLEILDNSDEKIAFPITKTNPALDNPFNWTMSYGCPRNEKEMSERTYINDTQRDMTYNWTACYGNAEAIKNYQENGVVSEGLFNGSGICHPVRKSDATEYRKNIDGYDYRFWTTYWQPKDNMPYRIVDDTVGDVFVVCYNDEPVDMKDSIRKTAEFLMKYADMM